MLRRGLVLVYATTSRAMENSVLILIFLRDCVLFLWRDTAVRKWVYISFTSIEKPLLWVRSYLDGVGAAVQYRTYYHTVTAPMKTQYRKLRKESVAAHSRNKE